MKKKWIRWAAGILTTVLLMGVAVLVLPMTSEASVTRYSYNSDNPFFNYYMDNVYSLDNSASIDIFFDTLPPTTNTSNFCSLATTSYPNINGRTVTVDTFARQYNESLNDPNFGEGVLIYQCIL